MTKHFADESGVDWMSAYYALKKKYDDLLSASIADTAGAKPVDLAWQPIRTAPRDGTNILIRFGQDGVSQAKYVAGTPHPWKFIDTNDGVTWLINHARDGEDYAGPSHWMPFPAYKSPAKPAAPPAPSVADIEDPVIAPRDLLIAACSAIDKKRNAPNTLAALRAITMAPRSAPSVADAAGASDKPLTDAQIEAGWRQTFSTDNPYCPCNLKSFTKAVRWAERAKEQK